VTVAQGQTVYSEESPPCTGLGLTWSNEELDAALDGPVATVLFDTEGQTDIKDFLAGIVDTEFKQDELRRVLTVTENIEDWRVGEAIAKTWLTDHRDCLFPWPDGRDKRKRSASLPGADLVGLHADTEGNCLAFGEVKTTSESKYPPRAMYGHAGLTQQLEDLRDSTTTRDNLFKYLGHRANGTAWMARFQQAAKRYLSNRSDVRASIRKVGLNCPEGMTIEFLALYLPTGRISGIGDAAKAARTEPA